MACDAAILKQVPLFALLDDDETAVLAGQVEITRFPARQRIYKIGDAAERAYVMVSGRRQGHDDRRGPSGRDRRGAGLRRVLRLCVDARPDAASDRCGRARRNGLHRGRPQRHHGAAATEAARGHGHAERARASASRHPATGADARRAQSERDDRGKIDRRRADRGRGRRIRRLVDVHHHVSADALHLHRDQSRAARHPPGIRIPSSCSTCSSPCSRRCRRRSS